MNISLDEKLKILNNVGEVEIKKEENGEWLCKHEEAMVKKNNSIIAYFVYTPTKEAAIEHYYDFVAQEGTSIILMTGFKEFVYNGSEFVQL